MIENTINATLTGDTLANALNFAAYLRENEMPVDENSSEVTYRGKVVCHMYVDGSAQYPGPWTIWTDGDYSSEPDDFPIDDHTKQVAWANVNICGNCGGSCSPGKSATIFGREFDSVCNAVMAFNNPDAQALECAKKMIEMKRRGAES